MPDIHPTAIIDPSARLAGDVTVGPYTVIEADVEVGPACRIGAHVTLGERLRLGRAVQVYNYACLGTASQDLKHRGQISYAEIGDECIIREFVTVNRSTREGGVTRVGPRVLLMAYCHVAHECTVDEGAILVNAATMGGEVHIGRYAYIGGLVGIHQFCHIGEYVMVGANSKVSQDIPPYLLADGHPARPFGPNIVGLRRNRFSETQIHQIHRIYRELFNRGRTLEENYRALEARFPDCPLAATILQFCRNSSRGFARPRLRRLTTAIHSDLPIL